MSWICVYKYSKYTLIVTCFATMETTESDKLEEGAGGDCLCIRIEEDGFAGMR